MLTLSLKHEFQLISLISKCGVSHSLPVNQSEDKLKCKKIKPD